jgi:7-cyano-7-deazaguanine synthase
VTPGARAIAVLAGGGLDSAVLVAHLAKSHDLVQPICLRLGLVWEEVEQSHLRRFLAGLRSPAVRPLVVLDAPIRDVYGAHWSTTREGVPSSSTPDDAVYLPGRNILLLSKPAVWCAMNGFRTIALGVLKGNPFPDSKPAFYRAMAAALSAGLDSPIEIVTPFAGLTKVEVIALGRDAGLGASFSCIDPAGELHCGRCNKCEERRSAFDALGEADPTRYA